MAKPLSPPALVSIRCGRRSFTAGVFPRQMITSGGLGTMGYGLPSAMGAQLGSPGKTVIDIDGDASFLMTCSEMATIAEYNIPVKIAILNNDFQGMVKQWQDLFYQRRYSQTKMKNPNFAAMAEAFGLKGIRCDRKEDVAKTVDTDAVASRPGAGRFLCRAQRACLSDGPQRQRAPRNGARNAGVNAGICPHAESEVPPEGSDRAPEDPSLRRTSDSAWGHEIAHKAAAFGRGGRQGFSHMLSTPRPSTPKFQSH